MPATLQIQYCGGWGYGRQVNALQTVLVAEFGDDLKFDLQADPGITGNFELTIVETGELIHSKKAGKGKCESNTERGIVVEKIQEYLDAN